MVFNILGVIAGPLMIMTDVGLLVVLGWIWTILGGIGCLGALIAVIAVFFENRR